MRLICMAIQNFSPSPIDLLYNIGHGLTHRFWSEVEVREGIQFDKQLLHHLFDLSVPLILLHLLKGLKWRNNMYMYRNSLLKP